MEGTEKLYVAAYGRDCDGYNPGDITKLPTEELARKWADMRNEGSDGLQFRTITRSQAVYYCNEYNLDVPETYNWKPDGN